MCCSTTAIYFIGDELEKVQGKSDALISGDTWIMWGNSNYK